MANPLLGAVYGLVGLLVMVAIVLLIREVVCWYFKINQGLALLGRIDRSLATLASRQDAETGQSKSGEGPTEWGTQPPSP